MSKKKQKSQKEEDTETLEVAEPEILESETLEKEPISEVDLLKDQLLRQVAEYDNYRKRTAKERLELRSEITADNITKLLPILDNIERALQAECSDPNYKKGIEMVHQSFVDALSNLEV